MGNVTFLPMDLESLFLPIIPTVRDAQLFYHRLNPTQPELGLWIDSLVDDCITLNILIVAIVVMH